MTYWFDMDGTIADFYGVDGWLDDLIAENVRPYEICKPLVNMSLLARLIHKAQANGDKVGIISWTSKGGSDDFNFCVSLVKQLWLMEHLPSVVWDVVKIVPYGTNKKMACGDGILFDDEEGNRNAWGENAYSPEKIFEILKKTY